MKRNSLIFLTGVMILAIFLSGCQATASKKTEGTQENNQPLSVYTTIFTIEDFSKKIGGEHVDVKSVYPAGADAHSFEPTMKNMMDIADADLFIYNGAGLEPFVDKAKDVLKEEKVTLVEASEGVELLAGDGHDHEHGHSDEAGEEQVHDDNEVADEDHEHEHSDEATEEHDHEHEHGDEATEEHDHHHDQDPHIWLDPHHAITMAENIKNAFIAADPTNESDYENNFNSLKGKLEGLDEELKSTIEATEKPEILVSHASYGYWEHRYGLEQISISGLNPQNEPSQKQLQNIVETVKEHKIHYIVYDQTPITKVADVVKKETGVTPVTLHNLEYITEEDLDNGADYFSIMEGNVEALKQILNP